MQLFQMEKWAKSSISTNLLIPPSFNRQDRLGHALTSVTHFQDHVPGHGRLIPAFEEQIDSRA